MTNHPNRSVKWRKTFPDHTFERKAREAGARVVVLWEEAGPPNTSIAWITCYAVGDSIAIVETFENDKGWNVFTPGRSIQIDQTIADALARCGVNFQLAERE